MTSYCYIIFEKTQVIYKHLSPSVPFVVGEELLQFFEVGIPLFALCPQLVSHVVDLEYFSMIEVLFFQFVLS